jgi:transporter family protein
LIESIHPNYLALISAVFTAFAQVLFGNALRRISPGVASIIANTVIFIIAAGFYAAGGGVENWPVAGILLFGLAGVIANFGARYLIYYSMAKIGVSRTQVLFQTSPIWTAAVAIVSLGERINFFIGAGTLAIVGGAILIVQDRGRDEKKIRFTLLLIPLIAALIMAAAPTLRKLAFVLIPSAAFGLTVACMVATTLQIAILPLTERNSPPRLDRSALIPAFVGAVMNAFAALVFWTALRTGDVIQVFPIRRLSVILVIVFSWLFFQEHERITWRVAAGGAMSVLGAAAIVWGR